MCSSDLAATRSDSFASADSGWRAQTRMTFKDEDFDVQVQVSADGGDAARRAGLRGGRSGNERNSGRGEREGQLLHSKSPVNVQSGIGTDADVVGLKAGMNAPAVSAWSMAAG